jgi:hypothetical protein
MLPISVPEGVPNDSSRSRFPMISSSPSTTVFFVDLVLTGEFASLDEPTYASRVVMIVVCLADILDFTGSERRTQPDDPTQKLRLPIVRFFS